MQMIIYFKIELRIIYLSITCNPDSVRTPLTKLSWSLINVFSYIFVTHVSKYIELIKHFFRTWLRQQPISVRWQIMQR